VLDSEKKEEKNMLKIIEELEGFINGSGSELEEALAIGQDLEIGKLRISRGRVFIRVTDLTNAGKRGKKVDEFVLMDLDHIDNPDILNGVESFANYVSRGGVSYKKALKMAEFVIAQSKQIAKRAAKEGGFTVVPELGKSQKKGVRVAPAGKGEISIVGKHISFSADLKKGFRVRNLEDVNEEMMITPIRGKRQKSMRLVYAWALENKGFIKNASFRQIKEAFKKIGADYHSYLGMD
jgi:hypothetical protein